VTSAADTNSGGRTRTEADPSDHPKRPSGNNIRHRLNTGGNRALNSVLHIIAACQIRDGEEAKEQPTAEETAAQIKNLSDLAAYSGGTLKRVIKALSVLTNRPI
jgi:hypothetical protein